jgi:hypothetical protein
MSKIQVQVEVEKEFMDLGVLLGGIAQAVLDKKPIGEIVGSAVGDLVKALGEISALPADWSESKEGCIKGVILGVESKLNLQPVAPPATAPQV